MSPKKKRVDIGEYGQGPSPAESSTQVTEVTAVTPCINQTEEKYLTLSGTIKRGNKAGQTVDVKVNVCKMELERLQKNKITNPSRRSSSTYCSLSKGFHILLWTILCVPLVFVVSSAYSFYLGTMTWYNIFSVFTDEKTMLYRILAAPILVLTYPILILIATFGMGIYAAFEQITYEWAIWLARVQDLEKGFYSWLCQTVHLEECSPYTEIIIVHQLPETTSKV